MSRLTRGGTAEFVARDQILRYVREQGNIHFSCLAAHEQDWQPYPVDPYSAICDDHTYIHTYILLRMFSTKLIRFRVPLLEDFSHHSIYILQRGFASSGFFLLGDGAIALGDSHALHA